MKDNNPPVTNDRPALCCAHALILASMTLVPAPAADLFWDAGNAGGNGDGAATYAAGTWNTTSTNWDQGNALPRVAWNNAGLDNAIFAGTYSTGTKTITIGANVTVNQIRVLTGSTSGNRYDIGASNTQNDFAITFGGSYGTEMPAITGNASFINTNFNAKITGTITGGLVLNHGSIATSSSSGRFAFTNANNDFIGDVIVTAGNLAANNSYGNAANRIVLAGGSLFMSSAAAVTTTFLRAIDVPTTGGINTNAATAGLQALDLTGPISGPGNLIRYAAANAAAISEVRLSGDMSSFTGLFEARASGSSVTNLVIQTTAQSAGSWKLSGGNTRLNTTDDTHLANGPGRSNLLMNGGTLDMNGKNETINGLDGATGTVRNSLADSTSTLTLGDGDASATFGGNLTNGTGVLALNKIGSGAQTLSGTNTHTGQTMISAGSLLLAGDTEQSPISVKSGATLVITRPGRELNSLYLENGSTISAPLDTTGSDYLGVADMMTLQDGAIVKLVPSFAEAPALGTYDCIIATTGINGSGTFVADFSANGPTRLGGSASIVGPAVQIKVTQLGAALTWSNQTGNQVWSLDNHANFLNGSTQDKFLQYDHVTFGPDSPAGTITLDGTLLPASVTIHSAANLTFAGSGSIAGSATLTKQGTGTLAITNSLNHTGDTTASAGTLAIDGALGTSSLLVSPAATLTGAGSALGPVLIEGSVAPGNGTGPIRLGNTTLKGTYQGEIDGASSDTLQVTGNLNLDGATLTIHTLNPPTQANYVIASCSGTFNGSFASVPAGFIVDKSSPGKLILWRESFVLPPVGAITFEENEGYPAGSEFVAIVNPDATINSPFEGTNGWSLSTSSNAAMIHSASSGGSFFGSRAIGASGAGTYIGAKLANIERSQTTTISFDAPFHTGTGVGFFHDLNGDGLFSQTESGMAFGIGGSPARFSYRNAGFGTENFGDGFSGITGNWYRFHIQISASSNGSRTITLAARNLNTEADFDFDPATEGAQPWTFTVNDADFGPSPESAAGLFIRVTASARIDNLRATSITPSAPSGYTQWAQTHGITGSMQDDDDKDGVQNGVEFFMGEDGKSQTILPRPDASAIITWNKGADYKGTYGPAADYVLETSTDLLAWTAVPESSVTISPTSISCALASPARNTFVRLKVMGPD